MLDTLDVFSRRYDELTQKLADPSVSSDPKQYAALMKEFREITPIVETYGQYKKALQNREEAYELMNASGVERELRELAADEYEEAGKSAEALSEELKLLLLPKDPNDSKNVIVEIRGGAGGEEAALFSSVLFRMYSMYAQQKGWQIELLGANETELGGYKEISFTIAGEGAYSRLKYESGVHRVQRVPETETQGRIHTHLPTGMVVECQDERSQYKNKDKAMRVLRSRLYEQEQAARDAEVADRRRSQVGTGDRSERIRTYNYPQGRVTDHRIGLTIYRLEDFLNGNLDEILDALIAHDRARQLEEAAQNPV